MFVPQKKLNTLLCHYVLGASSALLLCIIYIFRSLDQVWLREGVELDWGCLLLPLWFMHKKHACILCNNMCKRPQSEARAVCRDKHAHMSIEVVCEGFHRIRRCLKNVPFAINACVINCQYEWMDCSDREYNYAKKYESYCTKERELVPLLSSIRQESC